MPMKLAAPVLRRSPAALKITWPNGLSLSFALERGAILGIREVQAGSIPLRNPKKLWKPILTTSEGIHYSRFEFLDAKAARDGTVTVSARAIGSAIGIQEEQDEYLGDIVNLSLPDLPVTDRLEWEFKPSVLSLDERDFAGVSFQYRFISREGRKLYRLFDDASWEIGGHVKGNTLLLQGEVNPPATELTKDLFFTTACNYYGAEMTGFMTPPKRVSFQRLPRIGTIQAFDFLVHPKGALLGLFDPVDEVLSIIQKNGGDDFLHIMDELRRPLSDRFETFPKHILFHAAHAGWKRDEQRNLWQAAYDFVHEGVRRRYRVKPSAVLPRIWIPQIARDTFTLDGKTYPREKNLQAFADRRMDAWAAMGVKEICLHSIWHSDYTEDRLVFKDQSGMHGGLSVGSICNVRVHEVSPMWGGTEALAYFVRKAHAAGIQVQVWWASHLSRRAPIFKERPDFMLMARDGLPNGGGFGHQSLITVDLNNRDCFDWMLDKLVTLHKQTGFDGLFHDSYGNMTFLPMHYADPLRRGQQDAYARFVNRLQRAGVRTFTVEGIGPLGVGHFGMNLLPKPGKRTRNVQCALDWWLGQEDMIYGLNMGISSQPWENGEHDQREFAFRCLASGGRFGFTGYDADHTELWTGWMRDLNLIHGQFAPLTGRRLLLPENRGVLWQRKSDALLFAFQPFAHPVAAGREPRLLTPEGEQTAPVVNGRLAAQPWSIYRV